MSHIPPSAEFSNDRPLANKAEDTLNRAAFADRVGGVLRELPKGSSLVVGIHGPWGDGKTTVLNMLKQDLDGDSNLTLVEFNPWRFTDEVSMLAGFFRMLAGAIRAKLTTKGEDIAAIIERIGRIAAVVDDRFGKVADVAEQKTDANLETLRERLFEALLIAGKRIIVLVDDIDRLDKHEIHSIFRLIKACADFPNICYVLAFDDEVVAHSLGERYGAGDEASGRAFLDKIVQVPLTLPVAMKEDLRSLCLQHVEQALAIAGVELSREEISQFLFNFDRAIFTRVNTPRSAKRYGNALKFALPLLKGEVSTVDLLLMEALRVYYPAIYNCMRENYMDFAGVESGYGGRGQDGPRCAALVRPHVESLPTNERAGVTALLRNLFPRLGSEFGGGGYGSDWLPAWARARRVCSPDYCSRYFTYAAPKTDIRESEFDHLLSLAASGDSPGVRRLLESFFSGGKARRVIQRLRQRELELSEISVEPLCLAVAALGRLLPNDQSLFGPETPMQAGILISHLIGRHPAGPLRIGLAKKVMAVADPLWFGSECLRWLRVTDEQDKEDQNTLSKDQEDEARRALVDRIKELAGAGATLFDPDNHKEQGLLFEWWRAEGRDAVYPHLRGVFDRDTANIAKFLRAMAPRAWGLEDVVPRVGGLDAEQLRSIELLFPLEELAAMIEQHIPGDYAKPEWIVDERDSVEQRLAGQFMSIYKKWQEKTGESPAKEQA